MAAVARTQQQNIGQPDAVFAAPASSNRPASAATATTTTTTTTTAAPPTGAPPQHTPPQSVSSTSSPSVSPNSPQQNISAFAKRSAVKSDARPPQIGRPKNVGFVPAALRPTERPRAPRDERGHIKANSIPTLRSGPPTPPRSLHNSTDNLAAAGVPNSASASAASTRKNSVSTTSSGSTTHKLTPIEIPDNDLRPGTRGSTFLTSPTASLSNLSLFSMAPQQQGPTRTRALWQPDNTSDSCQAPTCPSNFGTFVRRHHCRRCGGIFCYKHAGRTVPLDAWARMIPTPLSSSPGSAGGMPRLDQIHDDAVTPEEFAERPTEFGWWRACDACYTEWYDWVEGLRQQRDSGQMIDFGDRMQLPMPTPRKSSVATGSVAGSAPSNWNWSTF